MPHWTYTKGAHDLGNGAYAYLQPDEGSGWGWSNGGLIVDGEESLLVDTMRDEKLTRAMLDALRDATGLAARDINKLVNTHKDGDHWFGNRLMAHADIIASQATAEAMKHATPELFRSALRNRPPGIVGDYIFKIHGPPFDFDGVDPVRPSRTFSGEMSLKVGDKEVRLIEVGPAHTEGDTLVHVPANRTVYTGDIVFLEVTPVIWAGPAENWLAAIDRIMDMDVDIVVPGHGPVTDKAGVQRVRDYLVYVRDETRKRYDAGMTQEEAVQDIALNDFANWAGAERIIVNVDYFYRQFSGDTTKRYFPDYLEAMARLVMRARR
jgi:glyoxylase-like metal-dependent hydrolase (beta-lactamase superfamily II)